MGPARTARLQAVLAGLNHQRSPRSPATTTATAATSPTAPTTEEIEFYRANGYMVRRQVFSAAEAEEMSAHYMRLRTETFADGAPGVRIRTHPLLITPFSLPRVGPTPIRISAR